MGNRDRYDNQRDYGRPDRDRRDEGMLERIKNDVKAWFDDDDDERQSRSDRKYSGYRAYEHEGKDHERNRQTDQDTWRGPQRSGERSRADRGRSVSGDDRGYGAAGSGGRNRDYASQGYGDRNYGRQDYRDRLAGSSMGSRDQDDEDFGGQFGRSRGHRPEVLSAEYWATPGPHAGIGPKGFKRSPDHLKERVCERLESAGSIDASDIEVNVDNEEVTLTGSVSDRDQKRLAEYCVESVRGVSDVHNRLTIRRASGVSDSEDSGARHDKSVGNPGKPSTKSV